MANENLKPGEPTPESGIYEEVGKRGGKTGQQADSTKDKPLPPTHQAGRTWKLVQPARHKSGK